MSQLLSSGRRRATRLALLLFPAEDHDDLVGKGWHVVYPTGTPTEDSAMILCPRCYEEGAAINPKFSSSEP